MSIQTDGCRNFQETVLLNGNNNELLILELFIFIFICAEARASIIISIKLKTCKVFFAHFSKRSINMTTLYGEDHIMNILSSENPVENCR